MMRPPRHLILLTASLLILAVSTVLMVAAIIGADGPDASFWGPALAGLPLAWVGSLMWATSTACDSADIGIRRLRGHIRPLPGHNGRPPSWTDSDWRRVRSEMDGWIAEHPEPAYGRHAAPAPVPAPVPAAQPLLGYWVDPADIGWDKAA